MFGDATEYAVLMQDRKTVVMVPTQLAKDTVAKLCDEARANGFTFYGQNGGATLRHYAHGCKLELKVQRDPADGRQKMVAYIPADYFVAEAQAKVYEVALPNKWAA